MCTTKSYSSTTPYYKVLKYHSTPYYKLILQYYKVLLQYYSVLQSTTPVLLWNVIYNARNNRHRHHTSPITAPATQNECHQWSASHMKRHFQCAEQQESPSNLTKYCACHAKWILWLMSITVETSFTMRGARGINLQPHQILRLPRKIHLMIDPHHIWNVIYNAGSNSQHPPTSPNTAPATQNDHPTSDRNLLKTAEVAFPMRDRSDHDPSMIRGMASPDVPSTIHECTHHCSCP